MNRPFLPSVLQNAIPLVLAVVLAACTTPPAPVVPAPRSRSKPRHCHSHAGTHRHLRADRHTGTHAPAEDAGIFHLRATLPVDAFYFRPVWWVNNGSGLAAHLTGEG
jgi:hypothetical protein